jgi:hypothetical protein
MTIQTDPLVTLWRQPGRPLNWQAWVSLADAASACLRYLLMEELRTLDATPGGAGWAWTHTHRELLEIKAASGHQEYAILSR